VEALSYFTKGIEENYEFNTYSPKVFSVSRLGYFVFFKYLSQERAKSRPSWDEFCTPYPQHLKNMKNMERLEK
jgi:hypothetical protein